MIEENKYELCFYKNWLLNKNWGNLGRNSIDEENKYYNVSQLKAKLFNPRLFYPLLEYVIVKPGDFFYTVQTPWISL